MKEEIAKKIQETNQKYLGKLVNQEIPQKLEKQLKDMDWSYLDLIHRKSMRGGYLNHSKLLKFQRLNRERPNSVRPDWMQSGQGKSERFCWREAREHVWALIRQRECLILV